MPELNFNALLSNGPQSVYQGFVQGQQLQNELAQQKQQRQVADIQLQNALRQQQMEAEDQEAWKTGAGNTQAVLAELQKRGLGKQAMALQKQVSETQAAKLKLQKDQLDLTKSVANQIFINPQNAVPILQSFYQRTGIDVSDDLAQIQQLGGNPDAIKKWASGIVLEADKLLPKFETLNLQGGLVRKAYDPITGAEISQGQFIPMQPMPAEVEAQKSRIARSGASTVVNVQEKAEAGAFGKMLVDQYDAISKQAMNGARTKPALDANLTILDKGFDTGFGTEAKAAGAKVLAALGVENADKYATNAQQFLGNASQAVLQRQLEQKGPQTEADAQRITQTGAQLGNTKAANRFLLEVAKEQINRDIEQRKFYDDWKRKTGSFQGAEDAWFAGEGGASLFDRPTLKKYLPQEPQVLQKDRRKGLDEIFGNTQKR